MTAIKNFMKNFAVWVLIFLGMACGLTYCVTMPDQFKNEPDICFQSRYCLYAIMKSSGKDFSGCTATYAITCKKILVDEHCKKKYPGNEKDESVCQKNLY